MKKPIVSIITVTYNAASSIEKTLKSVMGQSYPHIEYVVIDGGSVDDTMNILDRYKANINILISEKDEGLYDAMNKGYKHASGEWIIFLNSGDCFFDDNTIASFFTYYDIFKEKAIAFGNIQLLYPEYIRLDQSKRNPRVQSICHQAQFIKRAVLLHWGGYNQAYRIYADFDFQRKIFLNNASDLVHIPVTVAQYENNGLSSLPFFHYYKEYLFVGKNSCSGWYDYLVFRLYATKMAAISLVLSKIRKPVKVLKV